MSFEKLTLDFIALSLRENSLQGSASIMSERRTELLAAEKLREDASNLCSQLHQLNDDGLKMLVDPEAVPTMFLTLAHDFDDALYHAEQLLEKEHPSNVFSQLRELYENAKETQLDLLERAHLWEQLIELRDKTTDLLESKRNYLTTQETGLRPLEDVTEDFNQLVVRFCEHVTAQKLFLMIFFFFLIIFVAKFATQSISWEIVSRLRTMVSMLLTNFENKWIHLRRNYVS